MTRTNTYDKLYHTLDYYQTLTKSQLCNFKVRFRILLDSKKRLTKGDKS